MTEYDESDQEEDSYIGYNRLLLQQLILTKIKSRLLLNKSQSNWRRMTKMSAKKWLV